jgi:hypothetical protein
MKGSEKSQSALTQKLLNHACIKEIPKGATKVSKEENQVGLFD